MTIESLKVNLTLPVIASPMFLVSGTKLVIESCKNGIIGTFPSLNGRTTKDFEEMVIKVKTALESFEQETGKKAAPFGVNLIINKTNPRIKDDLKICAKHKVPLIITSLGAVKEIVDIIHNYGGLIFHDIVKKRHAQKAIEAGVDGIIAVAAGAGGHAGTANSFALIKEIRSFYNGTLVLAGGISSGQDILAAQILGADLVYMGTKFISTKESMASDDYKKMLVDSHIDDILYTNKVSGVHGNFLIPSIEKANIDLTEDKKEDFSNLNANNTKSWKDIWSAGHAVANINEIESVTSLINNLKKEYKESLANCIEIYNNFKNN